jgi:hypothetical protein
LYYQLKEILRSPFVDHFCCRERPAGSGLLLTEPDVAVDDIVAILDLIFAGQE